MLDLHARVHLDEVELAVLVQKLEGAGTAVADLATGLGAAFAHAVALFLGDARRRRLFDHLLVAALHGAVAFAEVDGIAMRVGQDLELDVARVLEELLHVNGFVAERGAGLGLGQRDGTEQRGLGSAPRACRVRHRRRPP